MHTSKSLIWALAVTAGFLAASPAAMAVDGYATIMGSYVVPDSKRHTDNGFGGTVLAGIRLTDTVFGEVNVFGHEVDLDSNNYYKLKGEVKSYGAGYDLNFALSPNSTHPFLLLGAGVAADKYTNFKDRSPFFDVGFGVLAGKFRGEIRGYSFNKIDTILGSNHAFDLRLNVGLQFGSAPAPAPVVVVAPTPAPVYAPPAPKPAPAPKMVDSDHDGVADSFDRCPGTPAGVEVDDNGCANISKVVLRGVNFGTGSAKLLPAASDTLRTVAAAMKANPKLKVEVDGYSDSIGDPKQNLVLSARRANSVKVFLTGEGIAADRLTTKGYGAASPADTNSTPAGRANNRRVAFKVTAQ